MRAVRDLLLSLLTAATLLLAVASWSRVAAGLSHAMPTLVLTAAVVVAAGVGVRASRASRWVTPLAQLTLAWAVVSIRLTHTPVPLRYAPRMRLENAFVAAGDTVLHAAPPVPVLGGVLALVLCGAAMAFVLADVLARTLGRPALSGLVLLATLAVPISIAGTQMHLSGHARVGVSPWLFALVALGWLAQVALAEGDRLAHWGERVDADTPGTGASAGAASGSRSLVGTLAVGGTATALALVVPLVIPTAQVDLSGFGGGGGNGHVTVTNPMVDVRRNLRQGADVPLVAVRTDDPEPSYLRLAVLTRFNATQWTAGDRSIPQSQDASGDVPIAGYTPGPDDDQHLYQISVRDDFASRWLPTPAPITTIDAAGDWRYDIATDDFIAAKRGLSTAGLSYDAIRLDTDLTAAALDDMPAGVGLVPSTYTSLPDGLPKIVAEQARAVIRNAGASTSFEEAVALQDWFRRTGHFTYSTDTDLGSGATDLATFLGTGDGSRIGYCQQFAAAMAAMARTLGIPARVAVGFLTPTRQPDGSYVYSSHDMHAWPELYFSGAGWVRFEPTPTSGTSVPTYAHDPDATAPAPSASAGTSASANPSARPSTKPRPDPQEPRSRTTTPAGRVVAHPVAKGGLVLLVLGMLAAAAALPRAVRRRRRRTRLQGSAEDAWAELHDTVIDLGIPWADGVSPRATRQLLDRYVGTHEGQLALDRLVDAIERQRYAMSAGLLAPDVLAQAIVGLEQGASPRTVRRAAWWPRSVLRRHEVSTADRPLDRVG